MGKEIIKHGKQKKKTGGIQEHFYKIQKKTAQHVVHN